MIRCDTIRDHQMMRCDIFHLSHPVLLTRINMTTLPKRSVHQRFTTIHMMSTIKLNMHKAIHRSTQTGAE
jgi:hypothetical protein